MARASTLRLSFSRWEVLGKEFGRAAIKCSIFFSRPPKVTLAFKFLEASSPSEEYSLCSGMQEKNAGQRNFFERASCTSVLDDSFRTRRVQPDGPGSLPDSHRGEPAVIHSAWLFYSNFYRSHPHEDFPRTLARTFPSGRFPCRRAAIRRTARDHRGRPLRCSRGARGADQPGRAGDRLYREFKLTEGRQAGIEDLDGARRRRGHHPAHRRWRRVLSPSLVAGRKVSGVSLHAQGCRGQ